MKENPKKKPTNDVIAGLSRKRISRIKRKNNYRKLFAQKKRAEQMIDSIPTKVEDKKLIPDNIFKILREGSEDTWEKIATRKASARQMHLVMKSPSFLHVERVRVISYVFVEDTNTAMCSFYTKQNGIIHASWAIGEGLEERYRLHPNPGKGHRGIYKKVDITATVIVNGELCSIRRQPIIQLNARYRSDSTLQQLLEINLDKLSWITLGYIEQLYEQFTILAVPTNLKDDPLYIRRKAISNAYGRLANKKRESR